MTQIDIDRIAADVADQAREMHIEVTDLVTEAYTNGRVLQLQRLHPLLRDSPTAPASKLDIARATLGLRTLDDGLVSITFDADCRLYTFHRLVLTAPPEAAQAHIPDLEIGAPGLDAAWHAEGTAFAAQFLHGIAKNLRALADQPTQLVMEDERLRIVTRARRGLRTVAAAIFSVWKRARPVKAKGLDKARRRRADAPKKRRKPPADRAAEQVRDWVLAATAQYAGVVERVRDTIEARVSLDDVGAEPLRGQLVFGFSTLRTRIHEMGLRATLPTPPQNIDVHLSPQRGVAGFFTGLTDDKVGDAELDRAYVIHLGQAAPQWVLSLRGPLLACIPARPTIHAMHTHIVVQLESVHTDRDGATADVQAVLQLWQAAAQLSVGAHAL